MSTRTYFVRLNIDDMSAAISALDSTEERGQWLEGFQIGVNGHPNRESWPEPKQLGYGFGLDCFEAVERLRDSQKTKGILSAESRKQANGTAQPCKSMIEPFPEPRFEVGSNRSRTGPRTNSEPDLEPLSNLTNNHVANNHEAKSHETKSQKTSMRGKQQKPTFEIWLENAKAKFPWWPTKDIQKVHDHYEANGWKQSNGNPIVNWQAAQRTCYRNWETQNPRAEYDYRQSQRQQSPERDSAAIVRQSSIFGALHVA
jgi:hypothetical protein